jgi:hypothetical protein
MKYDYHDLYDLQFEQLVVAICSKLLGIGIQEFTKGRDGGRDALFTGRANCFPSESKPWDCKFSDDDFFKNKSSMWKVMNEQLRNNQYFSSAKQFRETIDQFFDEILAQISATLSTRINDDFQLLNPASCGGVGI